MTANWQFEWFTSWDEILSSEFQLQWERFIQEATNSHVFFHPSLGLPWIKTYREIRNIKPLFLMAKSAQSAIFLPLVLWKRNWKNAWQRLLIPLGYPDYDYHDPLVISAEDQGVPKRFWVAFEEELTRRWRSSFDFCVIDGLRDAGEMVSNNWRQDQSCPYTDLTTFTDIQAFLKSKPRSIRGDVERRKRKLSELGEFSFHIHAQSERAEAIESLSAMLKCYAQRWPSAYIAPNLHQKIMEASLASGVSHFSEIRISRKPISWHFGFLWKNRYYDYIIASEQDYISYSPGMVHLLLCYGNAFELGIQIFDHLRGNEAYKMAWASSSDPLYGFEIKGNRTASSFRNLLITKKRSLAKRFGA